MNNIKTVAYCPVAYKSTMSAYKNVLWKLSIIIVIANKASEEPEHFNVIVTSKKYFKELYNNYDITAIIYIL